MWNLNFFQPQYNCWIGNNVTISENTVIGEKCKIFHSSSIGEIPQDLKFGGEVTKTLIGNNTVIREFVTINRGTSSLEKIGIVNDDHYKAIFFL